MQPGGLESEETISTKGRRGTTRARERITGKVKGNILAKES